MFTLSPGSVCSGHRGTICETSASPSRSDSGWNNNCDRPAMSASIAAPSLSWKLPLVNRSQRSPACSGPVGPASIIGWRATAASPIRAPWPITVAATTPRSGASHSRRCWSPAWSGHRTTSVTRRSFGPCRCCRSTWRTTAASGLGRPPCASSCTSRVTSGNARGTCWLPTPRQRKKRCLRQQLRCLPPHAVKLFEDETDLLLFPPLRGAWGRRGQPLEVRISGGNARRVVFGTLNVATGHRLFLTCPRQRGVDFQSFLRLIRSHYPGRPVALLLDEDPSHTAQASQELALGLGLQLLWLPKRCP